MRITFDDIEGSGAVYMDVMRALCGDTQGKSMVDLMCHRAPYTSQLGFATRAYVDCQDRPLDLKSEQALFVKSDVGIFLHQVPPKFYDVSICSDGIEHLSEVDGRWLLTDMESVSHRQILFTPLGEYMLTHEKHPDFHQSAWTPEKLESLYPGRYGYIVFSNFHPSLSKGAFFFWHCEDMNADFERVTSELKKLSWTKLS